MFSKTNPENAALLDKLSDNLKNVTGISWGAIIEESGKPKLTMWNHRPCWGEMRRYGSRGDFPKGTRPKDPHPGDLPRPITPGPRLAIGAHIAFNIQKCIAEWNEISEALFSWDSPYKTGFDLDGLTILQDSRGCNNAVVANSTDFDPTVWVALLMFCRTHSRDDFCQTYKAYKDLGCSTMQAIFASTYTPFQKTSTLEGGVYVFKNTGINLNFGSSYFLASKIDLPKYVNGQPHSLSNGRTMFEQEDYNRPEIQDLFLDKNSETWSLRVARAVGINDIPKNGWFQKPVPMALLDKVVEYTKDCWDDALDGATGSAVSA